MDNEEEMIVKIFNESDCTPNEMIKSLAKLLCVAMLQNKDTGIKLSNDYCKMTVEINKTVTTH